MAESMLLQRRSEDDRTSRRGGPGARWVAWHWLRRRRPLPDPHDRRPEEHRRPVGRSESARRLDAVRRLEHLRAVLERARTIVERGWLQHGWYETVSRPGAPRSLLTARPPDVDEIRSACLVAAVTVAAHGGGPRPDILGEAGPVLDLVWDALEESRGRTGPGVSGRAAPPEERVARMRDLTRWNDVPGRTRPDVLALLDRAISRSILDAVAGPARAGRAQVVGNAKA